MSGSDSEEDFMSDAFLNKLEQASSSKTRTSAQVTYTEKRKQQAKLAEDKQRANRKKSLKEREEDARRKALGRSLFEGITNTSDDRSRSASQTLEEREAKDDFGGDDSNPGSSNGNKALGMMLKMGWKVGESLGRTDDAEESASQIDRKRKLEEMESRSPTLGNSESAGGSSSAARHRVDPLKLTMWTGKAGLGARARSPTPPPEDDDDQPLPPGGTILPPEKLRRLEATTEDFRSRQMAENEQKRIEKRQWAARSLLMSLDEKKGLKTIPGPLMDLLLPPDDAAGSTTEEGLTPAEEPFLRSHDGNSALLSDAERLRRQMQEDRLDALDIGDDEFVRAKSPRIADRDAKDHAENTEVDAGSRKVNDVDGEVDWPAQIAGAKRVLAMEPATHLSYLIDQLRQEHTYCFWCQAEYSSFEEMDGPNGCPGEDEDDH